jgi:hypothetical protein
LLRKNDEKYLGRTDRGKTVYPPLRWSGDIIKVKEQLVERKDMDVNEQERLSNITLKHKLK